jgi:hypothetical protein
MDGFDTSIASPDCYDTWLSSRSASSQSQENAYPGSLPRTPGLFGNQGGCDSAPTPPGPFSFDSSDDWGEDAASDESVANRIQYTVIWKLTVNNRCKAKDTEQDVVVAPGAFWETMLRRKFETVRERKLPANRSFQMDETKAIVSITGKKKLEKRFDGLDIDWAVLEKQLRGWSHLLRPGKQMCIDLSFNCVEAMLVLEPSAEITRSGTSRRSATKSMLQELDGQVDASGQPLAWRSVRNLMRCPGPPCHLEPYCWLDKSTNKRYKLRAHHLRRLVQYAVDGHQLESHDDVPDDVRQQLYAEDQQYLESQSRASRGKFTPIHITNVLPSSHGQGSNVSSGPTTPLPHGLGSAPVSVNLGIPGPLDEAFQHYCSWLSSKVTREVLKREYQKVCHITLDEGLDLDLVYEAQDPTFYIDKGIKIGVARRFIRDIKEWAKLCNTAKNTEYFDES